MGKGDSTTAGPYQARFTAGSTVSGAGSDFWRSSREPSARHQGSPVHSFRSAHSGPRPRCAHRSCAPATNTRSIPSPTIAVASSVAIPRNTRRTAPTHPEMCSLVKIEPTTEENQL